MSYTRNSWKKRKCGGKSMQNRATRWVAEYIAKKQISVEETAEALQISKEKLYVGTEQTLDADELLKLCAYLRIRPENIPMD